MIIDIPLDYQPTVGEMISINVTGLVRGVCINPVSKHTVVVTIETNEDNEAEYIGPGNERKLDPFIPTNGVGGSTD